MLDLIILAHDAGDIRIDGIPFLLFYILTILRIASGQHAWNHEDGKPKIKVEGARWY